MRDASCLLLFFFFVEWTAAPPRCGSGERPVDMAMYFPKEREFAGLDEGRR
jgi:hypothetical protein